MSEYKQIVWLASYPKSGSTWTRCFFDAYFLGDVDLNELLVSTTDNMVPAHAIDDLGEVNDLPIELQLLTRPMAMLRIARAYRAGEAQTPLIIKTHKPNVAVNGVELLPFWLTKKTIHIVRDPRDVCPSFAKHLGESIEDMIQKMDRTHFRLKGKSNRLEDYIGAWGAHTSSFVKCQSHHVMTFRYEDMLADPVNEFANMLRHIGVEPDQDKVKKAVEAVHLSKLQAKEKEHGFKESSPHAKNQFFGEGTASAGKGKISHSQKNAIVKAFKHQMRELGYIK